MAAMTDAEMLAQAQAELQKILVGKQSNEVMVDGRRVRYGKADVTKLKSWIAELQARVAGRTGAPGAIGFIA